MIEIGPQTPIEKILAINDSSATIITDEKMDIIMAGMPAIRRASRVWQKQNTQVAAKLMTLTMLTPGCPYRTLRQIVAQIERKRQALTDVYFKHKKYKVRLAELVSESTPMGLIRADEIRAKMANAANVIEGALKEIGSYQRAYNDVCTSHKIPVDWDEEDMERAEVSHHIMSAFRLGIRDFFAHGRLGMGALEYFEQFGISPFEASEEICTFFEKAKNGGEKDKDYDALMNFLEKMAKKYQGNFKKVLERVGVKQLIDKDWLYLEG